MLDRFGPIRARQTHDRRYAFVFEPTERKLQAALQFTSDPDRVLLGLDQPVDRGTTPATLLPLLRLLAIDPWAQVLVLLPERETRTPLYVGCGSDLASLIKRHVPGCWSALTNSFFHEEVVAAVYHDLAYSDLAADVLGPAAEAEGLPGVQCPSAPASLPA